MEDKPMQEKENKKIELPGLNCGSCGFKACEDFLKYAEQNQDELKRCIHLDKNTLSQKAEKSTCGACASGMVQSSDTITWTDTLGRDFDFILETFPDEPGPRKPCSLIILC